MFCNKCGNQIPEDAMFCPVCGAPKAAPQPEAQPWPQQPQAQQAWPQQPWPQQPQAQQPQAQQPYPQQPYAQQPYQQQPYYAPPPVEDVPNKGLNILSFFMPIVGFIVYATSHQQTPIKAKAALKMSIIGVCILVGFAILGGVLGVVIPMLMFW